MQTLVVYIILFLIAILPASAQSQVARVVSGTINGNHGSPIAGAVVILQNTSDTTKLQTVISNLKGNFTVRDTISADILLINAFGFETQKVHNLISPIQITLKEKTLEANTVFVTGSRPIVKYERGNMIISVLGTYLDKYPSLSDIIPLIPGLNIKNDIVNVIGYGVPLIILDGKEIMSMQQVDILDPKIIENIKIITNPSAKYDARYKSVIEITTKKSFEKMVGMSIYNTAILGRRFSDDVGLNFNHRSKHFDNVVSYRYRHSELLNYSDAEEINDMGINGVLKNNYTDTMSHNRNAHTLFIASKYDVDKRNSIGLQYNFFDVINRPIYYDAMLYSKFNNDPAKQTDIHKTGKYHNQNHSGTLQYNHSFDSLSTLSFEGMYANKQVQSYNKIVETNSSDRTVIQNNEVHSQALMSNIGFETTFPRDYHIEVGARYATIWYNNFSSSNIEPQKANNSNNTEQTFALYAQADKDFDKLSVAFGLRGEWSLNKYNFNDSLSQRYNSFNFFPFLNLNYAITPKMYIALNYTSNISRPNFNDLSPVITYLNPYAYLTGNPYLQPTIAYNIDLSFVFFKKLKISGSYEANTNYLIYTALNDEVNPQVIKYQPINLNRADFWKVSVSYSNKFKFYQLSVFGMLQIPNITMPSLYGSYKTNTPSFYGSLNNVFSIGKKVDCILRFIYQTRTEVGNVASDPVYDLSLSVNVDAGKGWIISARAGDLLWRNIPFEVNSYANIRTSQVYNNDMQHFRLTVKYNFNSFKNIFRTNANNERDMERF